MAKEELILCVDIGAESVKFAEFSYPVGKNLVLERFAFVEYGGELKEEDRAASLKDKFETAIKENNFKAKKVHISISGQSAFIKFVPLPPMVEKEGKVRQIVEMEAKQNVPFPINEVIWDYQLIGGNEGGDNEIEVMFVVVKNDIITNITDIVENLGMETMVIDVAPSSCYNAARANQVGAEECVMILNIGGRNSTLVFIDSGRFYVRSIPIAGYTITQQVSREFGISFQEAEIMKRKHGFVALGGAYEEPESEVAATVSKIVRNIMTRLHGEINRSINVYRSQQKGSKPTKLFLAGGSSVMAFTPRFFSDKLKMSVEYFNPFQVVSLSDSIDREALAEVAHMFSEVIGLGLRRATTCPIEISLIPETLKKAHALKHKIPYFYASAASIIICLVIMFWGVSSKKDISEDLIKKGGEKLKQTKLLLKEVEDSSKIKDEEMKSYEKAKSKLVDRSKWVDLLNDIQERLPDYTWLTVLQPSQSQNAPQTTNMELNPDLPPPEQPARKRRFRPSLTDISKTDKITKSQVEWIHVEGHSLILDKLLITSIKNNFQNSEFFSNNPSDIKTIAFKPPEGENNFCSFQLALKLKTPITK